MRTLCRLSLALGAWLASSSALASALDTLSSCAIHVPLEIQGIVALEAECSELEAALNELGLTAVLAEGWQDTLNRDGLRDLETLTRRYQETLPANTLDNAALPGILQDLEREQPQAAKSWWEAVKEWLRSWFEQDNNPDQYSWLERWLSKLKPSQIMMRVLIVGLAAAAVIAAIAFVINELRVAGVLARGNKTNPSSRRMVTAAPTMQPPPTITDLDNAAMHDKPAILLRLLISRLVAARRLQAERNLTHRELTVRSEFATPQERQQFTQVAQLAERVLYGHTAAEHEHIENVVAEGRVLLQQLASPRDTP